MVAPNFKLSGADTWGIIGEAAPRVCVPATEGRGLSALLEAEPVPLALLKTNKASIRLIVKANKQNASAVM
ncbi:hypothetical protein A6K25_01995 [Alteromonas stellipolaris]|uniref:hypothetical protein n=1 Tax=Alteromonas stellipolaris TaxID=233316 RepID=UPI0007B42DE9|nr:hypothetical protein [Alteromonas stellipolaris]ANB20162.1 hypothetical protein A6K25_01995 [Alteromonas stellipolaris]